MKGSIAGRRPARLIGFLTVFTLALLALAVALLWLPPAGPAQAQEDTTRPTITAGPVITSSPAGGDTYGEGETVSVAVTFSEAVTVTGEPRVRLAVGERKRWARYSGGSDSATLTFTYTVKKVDVDDDGISIGKNSLKPNGGSIQDGDGNAARLKHLALADQSGHKVQGSPAEPDPDRSDGEGQEEPDNIAPTVSSLSIVSTPKAHGSYAAGETITVEATFSEPVFVTGAPCLLITVGQVHSGLRKRPDVDKQQRPAAYVSGSGTNKLRFGYTVVMGDRARKGIAVFHHGHWAFRLRCPEGSADATIRDAADNDAVLYHSWLLRDPKHMVGGPDVYPDDRTGPAITGLQVLSSPKSGNTYRDGETILVGVTFSEPVTVSIDSPFLGIWMGSYRKEMTYRDGSGSNRLTLGYRVQSKDRDGDGISTLKNMVLVYDGKLSVTDSADNPAKVAREAPCPTCWTTLEHGPLATQPGHQVAGSASDTNPPTVQGFNFSSSKPGPYAPGHEIRLRVLLSEQALLEGLGGAEPSMEFTIGGETRTAAYASFNPPTTSWLSGITFTYTVQEGDEGVIAIGADSVGLPAGASLRDHHDNLTTSLPHPPHTPGHRVTGSAD